MIDVAALPHKKIRHAILQVVQQHEEDGAGFVYGFWIADLLRSDRFSPSPALDLPSSVIEGYLWDLIDEGRLDIDSQGRVTSGCSIENP